MSHGSDGAATKFSGVDESVETLNGSTSIAEDEEDLQRDLQLILHEHSRNVIKKWGNSKQWVLELRDGSRVAVLIQISFPSREAAEVVEDHNQLALVQSDYEEGDVVVVEDWVSNTLSKEAELPNEECFSPLAVEPMAFSLPLASEVQEVVGVENIMRHEHSEWFQSRFNGFDDLLGTSLQGLEEQATNFLLVVEDELKQRVDLEQNTRNLKNSGVKGIRELMGPFSSINYGSTSARRRGNIRDRALLVSQ